VTDNASVVPPVVALVIVERADDALDDTLAALAQQDVGSLRVLVMDATAEGAVLHRTNELAPAAIVRRASARTFAGAANEAARLIAGSGFLCLLSAGVEPESTAFRGMLEEAFRSNAGVVGPKFVDRAAPERLDSVGYGSDKFAEVWMPVAAGELDQEQHDAVVDRFMLSSRCLMVRSDLFSAIGGFDDTLSTKVAEIDLCWRAHASGARVLVVPDARARTRLDAREPDDARRDATERLGLVLSNYSFAHLVRVLPQSVLVTIASAIGNLLTLRPARAAARLLAWPGVLGRVGHIRARRASFGQLRNVPDADIRRLQQRGSARLGVFLRGRRGERRLAAAVGDTSRTWFDDVRSSIHWPSALAWFVVLASFVLGSRDLLSGRVPSMAGLPSFPARASDAIGSYLSGWRPSGLGHVGAAPTGLGLIGVLSAILAGKIGLARTLVTVGLMVVGYIGIWRAARPFGNERSRLAALVVYGLVPLAPNALASGRWGGLAAYAAAPFAVSWLGELAGIAPFANRPVRDSARADALSEPTAVTSDDAVVKPTTQRSVAVTARLALVSALAAAVAPAWVITVAIIGVVLAICSLASRRVRDARRVIAATVGVIAAVVLLHLPWALGSHGFWEASGPFRSVLRSPVLPTCCVSKPGRARLVCWAGSLRPPHSRGLRSRYASA
jgi:GT2 family glycosyltransferase